MKTKVQDRKALQEIKADYLAFKKQSGTARFDHSQDKWLPYVGDKTTLTPFEPHYTYHPAWAARIIAKIKPHKHVDISSSLRFCTMISAFVPTDFYDFRPANLKLSNLNCRQANLLNLPFANNSVPSLSCMHTIEHIGLGRYGDEIDYNGDLKAMNELVRVLAKDGHLLIVVPIGKPRLEFNAHRIYSYDQITSYFKDLHLKEFSLIPDDFEPFGLIENASKEFADQQYWGCGCFWFSK
ncbi:DUF268 domain-containing protein [Pedobacter xixiisoli]|uniref:DUF268 domain-containing protein n=1 Tax=Pedobacter xixiisoli TaxID=1476464 RepID=UPI001C542BB5|nr:DUF268 domain-containing protein [Pedobacter xixiisoli]